MIFSDSHEFLAVLEQTLREQAERNGRSQDYINLKEELAIERFLARITPDVAIVKGGTAAMLTLSNTPHTKDVDLVITDKVVQSLGLDKMNPPQRTDALAELVQDQIRKAPNREVVDKSRLPVPAPPDRWNDRFDELIEQSNTNLTMREAMNIIKEKIN